MSPFVDRALLQLHDPAALGTLLTGGGSPPFPKFQRLLDAVFAAEGVDIDHVAGLSVSSVDPVVLISGRDRLTGTLTTTAPSYGTADVRGELARCGAGPWAHLMASVQLTVVVADQGAGVDSVTISSIENIQSFADFESRFRYIDLPAFLAAHRISTVEQLREAAQYVLAEVRLTQPPAFDPNDPANSHEVVLCLAVLVLDSLDLAAGLMGAQLLWAAGTTQPPGQRSTALGEARRPFAVAVVFPSTALGDGQPTAAAIDDLYAKSGVLPLFADPP